MPLTKTSVHPEADVIRVTISSRPYRNCLCQNNRPLPNTVFRGSPEARLFREALAINPGHEDSHYYLANCLAGQGDIDGAVAELDALARLNPQSHRAFQRKGELLAASAGSREQFDAAWQALETALRLNPEETGTLLLLGQVELARGEPAERATEIRTRVPSESAGGDCLVSSRLSRLEARGRA